MNPGSIFTKRLITIASMHEKHKAIESAFKNAFNSTIYVPEHLNTDVLGTFTGEIERTLTPLNAAIQKCELALASTGNDIAIATEGSFGPHPTLYFLPIHSEIMVLVDKKNNLIIEEEIITQNTNFQGKYIKNVNELEEFINLVEFPSHAVILGIEKGNTKYLKKGINHKNDLYEYFYDLIEFNKTVYIETDMRAMLNPTRMKVIEELAYKLVTKMQLLCPKCQIPGFGISSLEKGLPCENCHLPTRMVKSEISQCKHCAYVSENQIESYAYAGNCDFCNP